ncbi:hypothetical protein [Pseudosulfitobacter pseudonitzschiae]|uniref:hypothetical protein n=1 Tax=Pseudosulfitobacter pseudonitzschiae TaxID=1402135 RepID=UPI001AF89CAB|nr:hypothetical protein [Pseudosulfitobacter pseudonitzschiae]MBM1816227.1 hypothetical protein [Pseudosulfitobacter pseudonitzschiae]MBM1833718.1 hypothetical protein [Pseudosulfitobacter pseudonitzschiae]MBM1838584.1 hypothetical protein [Pseudosulfitobacter pseudonitzschiae]MBM1842932.1 hypothetical protein [Pseudosulfitobacter pseudonitzschiae]MBM1847798.1 hypothetical protein [Pseudosulfitobacter pseudonitzschiae]
MMDVLVQQTKLHANWQKFTDSEEEQRLIVLEERIARQKRILADSIAERRKIMMRAIRRMRRSKGKT